MGEIWNVTRVSDGDTIAVEKSGETRRIRFCGIDTPESKQAGGQEAKSFVENAIARSGKRVRLEFVEKDRYDRWIAEVWINPGTGEEELLNALLIATGNAWAYKQYWKNCPNRKALEASENSAIQNGMAISQKPNAIAPWEWRKENR